MGRSGRGNSSDHILHLLVPRYLLPDSLENLPRRSYIARRLRKCFRIWSGRWESNPRPKLGKLLYCHYTTPAALSNLLIIHNQVTARTAQPFSIFSNSYALGLGHKTQGRLPEIIHTDRVRPKVDFLLDSAASVSARSNAPPRHWLKRAPTAASVIGKETFLFSKGRPKHKLLPAIPRRVVRTRNLSASGGTLDDNNFDAPARECFSFGHERVLVWRPGVDSRHYFAGRTGLRHHSAPRSRPTGTFRLRTHHRRINDLWSRFRTTKPPRHAFANRVRRGDCGFPNYCALPTHTYDARARQYSFNDYLAPVRSYCSGGDVPDRLDPLEPHPRWHKRVSASRNGLGFRFPGGRAISAWVLYFRYGAKGF